MEVILFLTVVLVILAVINIIYWVLVRPVVLDSIDEHYSLLKSELDWAIIDGLPQAHSRAAIQLAHDLCDWRSVRILSFGILVMVRATRKAEIKATVAKEFQTFKESPAWLREMRERDMALMTKAVLANSPFWWFPICTILLFKLFSTNAKKWWDETQITAGFLRAEHQHGLDPVVGPSVIC